MPELHLISNDSSAAETRAGAVSTALRSYFDSGATKPLEWRLSQLDALEHLLNEREAEILAALHSDLRKPALEAYGSELGTVKSEIRFIRKRLSQWMKPERVPTAMIAMPGRSFVHREPLGVVMIIAPWNYPFQTAIFPLVGALAAGNCVVIKPSEVAPNTSALLAEWVPRYLDRRAVQVVEGGVPETTALLRERWDHIFYTGNGTVGRIVMEAAAKHLTPVTLELGGKSPTIICEDFDVDEAASRIMYAKCVNAGQTCLAPDYLFIPEGKQSQFVAAASKLVTQRYPDINDPSFTSVIDDKAFRRLKLNLEDAEAKGATIVPLVPDATFDEVNRKFPPHLVLDVTDDMMIMQEEIFGPLFPVKTYRDLDEVIEYVTSRDRPLGYYFFTHDNARKEKLLYNTISGGVTINNCLIHVAQHDMPFGGIGASGMGHYHGWEGFAEFSKLRPVHTNARISFLHWFFPPYTGRQEQMIDLAIKYKR